MLMLFIAFIFVFSTVSIKADGGVPIMGKNCGITAYPPCPVAAPIEPTEDTAYYKTVIDYLAQLFG
jgi:hypothetical protein